jgi:hypothetical protein
VQIGRSIQIFVLASTSRDRLCLRWSGVCMFLRNRDKYWCLSTKLHGIIFLIRATFKGLLLTVKIVSFKLKRLGSIYNLTNSMGTESFLGTASYATIQCISIILWTSNVHYRVHKSLPLAPILSESSSALSTASYLSKIHFSIIEPPTSWSSYWSLSFWFSLWLFSPIFYMRFFPLSTCYIP